LFLYYIYLTVLLDSRLDSKLLLPVNLYVQKSKFVKLELELQVAEGDRGRECCVCPVGSQTIPGIVPSSGYTVGWCIGYSCPCLRESIAQVDIFLFHALLPFFFLIDDY
jgi:hypothetical protein